MPTDANYREITPAIACPLASDNTDLALTGSTSSMTNASITSDSERRMRKVLLGANRL